MQKLSASFLLLKPTSYWFGAGSGHRLQAVAGVHAGHPDDSLSKAALLQQLADMFTALKADLTESIQLLAKEEKGMKAEGTPSAAELEDFAAAKRLVAVMFVAVERAEKAALAAREAGAAVTYAAAGAGGLQEAARDGLAATPGGTGDMQEEWDDVEVLSSVQLTARDVQRSKEAATTQQQALAAAERAAKKVKEAEAGEPRHHLQISLAMSAQQECNVCRCIADMVHKHVLA